MPDDLYAVAYVSRSQMRGDPATNLRDLVERAAARNAADNLTGALICSPNYFAQIIEGPLAALEDTFERIQCDRRHKEVEVLFMTPLTERSFPHWGMASAGVTEDDSDIRRVLEMVTDRCNAPDEAGQRAMDLLTRLLCDRELA